MTIDYFAVDQLITQAVPTLIRHQNTLSQQAETALDVFLNLPISQEALMNRSDQLYASMARMMRWARPTTHESITAQYFPPAVPPDVTLVANDASNYLSGYEDYFVDWGLINTATLVWPRLAGVYHSIAIQTEPNIFFANQLITPSVSQFSQGHISLLRDVREREILAQMAIENQKKGPVVVLRDGPVETWGDYSPSLQGNYLISLQQITQAYQDLYDHQIPLGGFVSTANTTLLVRMIEIALSAHTSLAVFRENRNNPLFPGITDASLLQNWLAPCARSAIFKIVSQAKSIYPFDPDLAIHLFFLNVSNDERHPSIARVEIPGWMCERPELISQLHALILDQCYIAGISDHPFPYILARCDEESHISDDDIDCVRRMILSRYLNEGGREFNQNPKDFYKNLTRGTNGS